MRGLSKCISHVETDHLRHSGAISTKEYRSGLHQRKEAEKKLKMERLKMMSGRSDVRLVGCMLMHLDR